MFRRSKKPYTVKPKGRAGLVYTEGDHSMLVDSEMLAGPDFDMVVYLDSITKWDPPHEGEVVTSVDRTRIRHNIAAALSNARIDWQ